MEEFYNQHSNEPYITIYTWKIRLIYRYFIKTQAYNRQHTIF